MARFVRGGRSMSWLLLSALAIIYIGGAIVILRVYLTERHDEQRQDKFKRNGAC